MQKIINRVAARHLASTVDIERMLLNTEEAPAGPHFRLFYLPAHKALLPQVTGWLERAERDYAAAGLPLKAKCVVFLKGGRGSLAQRSHANPQYMTLTPATMGDPGGYATVIHELAHMHHFRVLGENYDPVHRQFAKASRTRATGGGSSYDQLQAEWAKIKRARDLKIQETLRPRFRKGDKLTTPVRGGVETITVTGVSAGKSKVFVERTPPDPVFQKGRPDIVPNDYLNKVMEIQTGRREVLQAEEEAERLLAEMNAVGARAREAYKTRDETAYNGALHDWMPTRYARTNHFEWFAEMVTATVFHPEKMKPEVREWLVECWHRRAP